MQGKMLNRDDLLRPHLYYGLVPTSAFGDIGVFFLSMRDLDRFIKSAGEALDTQTDEEFACTLFPLICTPSTHFVDGKYRSAEPVLSAEDIKKLTPNELDGIAGVFLEHNREFYCDTDVTTEKKPGGGTKIRIENEKIKHPILEGEGKLGYLHRTFRLFVKEQTEWMEKLMKNFSQETKIRMGEVFAQGEKLKDLIESIRLPQSPIFQPPVPAQETRLQAEIAEMPSIDILESPFVNFGKKIDLLSIQMSELIDISSESGDLLLKMNSLGFSVAGELRQSGATTVSLSKKNIWLGGCVLFVAIAGLIWSFYSSVTASNEQTRLIQENKAVMEEMVKTLKSIDRKSGIPAVATPAQKPQMPGRTTPAKKRPGR